MTATAVSHNFSAVLDDVEEGGTVAVYRGGKRVRRSHQWGPAMVLPYCNSLRITQSMMTSPDLTGILVWLCWFGVFPGFLVVFWGFESTKTGVLGAR